MHKSSFHRLIQSHVKQALVHCDRLNIQGAQGHFEQAYQAIDELLDFTKERIETKKKREAKDDTPKSEPQEDTKQSKKAVEGSQKGPGSASKRVSSKRDDSV